MIFRVGFAVSEGFSDTVELRPNVPIRAGFLEIPFSDSIEPISPDYPIEPIIKGKIVSAAIFDAIIYVYNKR